MCDDIWVKLNMRAGFFTANSLLERQPHTEIVCKCYLIAMIAMCCVKASASLVCGVST